ncbi:S1 family peptidase [Kitasatospora sp. NPDC004240]
MYKFNFDSSETIDVDPVASGMRRSVFPILIRHNGDKGQIEGTAFCVTVLQNGEIVCVTAKHVVEQLDGMDEISAFLLLPRMPEDGTPDGSLVGLYIRQVSVAESHSDVALLVANVSESHRPIGELHALEVTMDAPTIGSGCMAVGYPQDSSGNSAKMLASRGFVEEIHVSRRDAAFSTFPSFRMAGIFRPAMSGGPIIDSNGNVAGVVSHGMDDSAEDPVSYGAALAALAELKVELHDAGGELRPFTFAELVQLRAVRSVSQGSVTFSRDDDGVRLSWSHGGSSA